MTYPCPYCGAAADPRGGCGRCGAAPDPQAAEVIDLDRRLPSLRAAAADAGARLARARAAFAQAQALHAETVGALRQAEHRRAALAAAVTARVAAAAAVTAQALPAVTAPPPPPAGPPPPETSARTAQTVLFVLGGLLLGAAAVAFTAVAWVTYGVTVRAAILAAGTALALAAAPPLRRRGLPGTAETCTALGVLLLLLDGYAARSVDLFGLRDVGAAGYAAAVCAGTAALSWAYARAVDVAAGRYAAWLVAQPVALLVAGAAGAAAAGYALALAVQAWGNAALLGRARRAGLRVLAGIGLVAAAAGAALVGVAATLLTAGVVPAAGAAAGAALAAAAACYGAYRLPGARVRDLGDAAAVAGTGTALAAWCATAWPSGRLLAVPAVALVYASAHLALRHRLVPRARRSTQYAVAAGVAVGAVPVLATSAGAALDAIGRGAGTAAPPWGWLPLVALGLTGAAVRLLAAAGPLRAVLDPHRRDAAVVAAAAAAPLVGAALALPGWGVALLAAAVAALAAPAAALAARGSSAALRAATAGFLGAYALLLPVARPAVLAGVASLLLAGALAAAVRADPGSPAHRVVGGLAAAAAVLLTPLALVQALAAAGVPAWWQARAYLAALAGLVAATWWLGRRRRAYRGYAAAPVLLLSALLPLWAGAGSTREPLALYAGLALLAVSAVVHLARAQPGAAALAALLPALTWLVACGPALANVVLLPLAWLTDIWSGRPAGVGLSPVPTFRVSPAVPGGVLLAFAAVALVRARPRGRRTALWVCAAGAVAAAPLLSAGLEAPWPATPAVSLVLGLGALAAAARYGAAAAARPVAAAAVGLPLALAGLAGTLPTAWSTLAGLGLVCLVATGVAATARLLGARMAAAAAATAAGLTGVGAAGAAAGLTRPWTGVAVLGGVLAAVAVEAALRTSRPGEAAAVEMAGGAGLVVALLLTVGSGRHAALVCALWGIAMGARALRPGETRHRRRGHLAAGAVGTVAAWWLLAASWQLGAIEAYTAPAAGAALLCGWAALRGRPDLSSWVAYGPGLGAGLLPTVALVLAGEAAPVRRLLVGAVALATVLWGVRGARQAPVVLGGASLAAVTLYELTQLAALLPSWVVLGAGGAVLLFCAVTVERRRRDLTRLAAALRRMR